MKTRFALTLTLLLTILPVWESSAQRHRILSPDEVIEQLVSSDHTISLKGIDGYQSLPSDQQRTPEVKSALIKALENENERVRRIVLRGDDAMPMYKDEGSAERALTLVREVIHLRNPSTIPLLLPWPFDNEIIDFGRQAFEPVLNFVETPQPGTTNLDISDQLYTLRMMVDYWGLSSFSGSELERMKRVATKYIVGFETSTMNRAISLASSLQEVELLQMANILLNSEEEVAKHRDIDRDWVMSTVTSALMGTLNERQYVPYEQRKK